jgi:protein SCO1
MIFVKTSRILGFLFLFPLSLPAQTPPEQDEPEIGISEQLDKYVPRDITLISENNDTVQTGELFGTPTVLSLVYYRCPGICTPLMDGLADVIKQSGLSIGKDYKIITVSFNPKEGTELARRKKNNYVNLLGLQALKDGWTFYTTDSANIARLTQSVGFNYKQSGNDYMHVGTLIFLSPDGKITRYLNGTHFLPFEFKMALIEASEGKSGPTINKVLQYCYSYDPAGQGYVLSVTRVAGILITFILIIFFISLALRSAIRHRNSAT